MSPPESPEKNKKCRQQPSKDHVISEDSAAASKDQISKRPPSLTILTLFCLTFWSDRKKAWGSERRRHLPQVLQKVGFRSETGTWGSRPLLQSHLHHRGCPISKKDCLLWCSLSLFPSLLCHLTLSHPEAYPWNTAPALVTIQDPHFSEPVSSCVKWGNQVYFRRGCYGDGS